MTARTIRTNGAEIVLDDSGSEEPALIFLHYWGGSARTWTPVIERLVDRVHKVAVNQRGWGGSRGTDGRYDLNALADDVASVVETLGIVRYVLVGHSMGGKVAQVLAGRRPLGLAGLVLVAPAPPTPMQVPDEVRASMLASYQSREGVTRALAVLAGPLLDDAHREQVIEDTLRSDVDAKRYWPEQGMTTDVSAALADVTVPVAIVLAELDQVERGDILRPIFGEFLPGAKLTHVPGAGHLIPLEAPQDIATACEDMLALSR